MLTKKWMIRIGLGLCLLLLLVIVGIYAEWKYTRSIGQEMLDKEVAKLDAKDPDWRAAELCAKRNASLPPKEKNSADRAMEAYDLIPESYKKWRQDELASANETTGVLTKDKDLPTIASVHADASRAIAVARTIRDLPRGGFPMTYAEPNPLTTLMEPTQRLRMVASILDLDAVVLAGSGDANGAIQSVHAILHTARAVGDQPTLIAMLIRIAITTVACRSTQRTLGWGEPTAGLAELQAALTEDLAVPRLVYGFRSERAMLHLLLTNLDNGAIDMGAVDGQPPSGLRGRTASAPLRRTLPKQHAKMLELYGQMLDAEKRTGKERTAAYDAIQPPPATGGLDSVLIGLLMPALDKMVAAENRCRAVLATTAVALACERFRLASGRFPNSIAEIPKTILPQVPNDPYTGDPLKIKTRDDGIVIYAVGADRIDDGGTNLDLTAKVGGDVGFKLLLPNKRRQPAPPPADDKPDDIPPP